DARRHGRRGTTFISVRSCRLLVIPQMKRVLNCRQRSLCRILHLLRSIRHIGRRLVVTHYRSRLNAQPCYERVSPTIPLLDPPSTADLANTPASCPTDSAPF